MFETIISVIGTAKGMYDAAKDVCEMYQGVGAVLKGERKEDCLERIANHTERLNATIERLADNILYAQDLQAVQDTSECRVHKRSVMHLWEFGGWQRDASTTLRQAQDEAQCTAYNTDNCA